MTRNTSIEAFNKIKEEGLLSERRWQVYCILFQYGPLTAHEMVAVARRHHPVANQTGFNARLSELEYLGCVERVGDKINPVSGCSNALWDVTVKLPVTTKKLKKHKCPTCKGKGFLQAEQLAFSPKGLQ